MKDTIELKKSNVRKCIKLLWNLGSVTKPQLAAISNLTPVTTHKFINELVGFGLVTEVGVNGSQKGKKASIYEINPYYGYFIGVNFYNMIITVSLFDFCMNRLHIEEAQFPERYSEMAFDAMCELISNVAARTSYPILGIGVTLSGLVDFHQGIVTSCLDMSGWNRIPLKSKLEERFKTQVVVENDVNACALAMKWHNASVRCSVLVNISGGVGIGVIINDEVFRGQNSYAGELGHATISISGRLCKCGNRGCIEGYLSDPGIIEESHRKDMAEVIEAAVNGDLGTNEVLGNKCEYIAILLDYIVKAYDPNVIYLRSTWLSDLQVFFGRITDAVFSKSSWLSRDRLNIVLLDSNNDLSVARGPAFAVFDNYIDHWGD